MKYVRGGSGPEAVMYCSFVSKRSHLPFPWTFACICDMLDADSHLLLPPTESYDNISRALMVKALDVSFQNFTLIKQPDCNAPGISRLGKVLGSLQSLHSIKHSQVHYQTLANYYCDYRTHEPRIRTSAFGTEADDVPNIKRAQPLPGPPPLGIVISYPANVPRLPRAPRRPGLALTTGTTVTTWERILIIISLDDSHGPDSGDYYGRRLPRLTQNFPLGRSASGDQRSRTLRLVPGG